MGGGGGVLHIGQCTGKLIPKRVLRNMSKGDELSGENI